MKTLAERFPHLAAYKTDHIADEQWDWLILDRVQWMHPHEYGYSTLDASNYDAIAESLASADPEGNDYDQVNGYFIVRPGSSAADVAQDIEDRLADYPVLNEDDFSRREHDAYGEAWDNYGRRDFLRLLRDTYGFDDCGAVYCFLDDTCSSEELRELFESGINSGEYYIPDSDSVSINFRSFDMSRKDLAKHIRALRAAQR